MSTCLVTPSLALPTLPPGFGFGLSPPPVPQFGLPNFCCKLPPIPFPPIPKPRIGLALNPAVVVAINDAIAAINFYLRSIPLNCPLE